MIKIFFSLGYDLIVVCLDRFVKVVMGFGVIGIVLYIVMDCLEKIKLIVGGCFIKYVLDCIIDLEFVFICFGVFLWVGGWYVCFEDCLEVWCLWWLVKVKVVMGFELWNVDVDFGYLVYIWKVN